jgi:hypothetical protein
MVMFMPGGLARGIPDLLRRIVRAAEGAGNA